MDQSFVSDLTTYIRAGYPILYVVTGEEDRAIDLLDEMLRQAHTWTQPRQLHIWSITRGFVDLDGKKSLQDDTRRPEQALLAMRAAREPGVFVFKDFHPYLKDGAQNASLTIRLLRDLAPELKGSGKTLVWLSPVQEIPPELEKDITLVDLPLPTEAEYRHILETMINQVKDNPRVLIDLDDDAGDEMIKACQGLTRAEAENALAKAIVSRQGLSRQDVKAILGEKEQIIRKSGILEYTASVEDFGQIGGLGNLKTWLKQHNAGFTQKALDFGLPHPRGVMLVGVPGCGKSLCAKAVALEWHKPLLRFDLGRVFAGLVGESEERMRKALAVAEGVAPAILWIDEIEKGLAGTGGGGDGGVASRVFGNLLTWMEEKTKPVFVVMTANDIAKLPPELLRKGRIDEIFFVDLPTPPERAEILAIHLVRRGRAPSDFDFRQLADATDGFSGAELAEMVNSALYDAFATPEKTLTTAHLVQAAKETIPLSRSRQHDIEALRRWAADHCRMAAGKPDAKTPADEDASAAARRQRVIDL
jgi:ATP-dependent 26S proteasome regulatory subunit